MKPARQTISAPLAASGRVSAASNAGAVAAKARWSTQAVGSPSAAARASPPASGPVREHEAGLGRVRRVGHVARQRQHVRAAARDQDRDAPAAHSAPA